MLQGRVLLTGGSGTLGKAMILHAKNHRLPIKFTVFARSESRLAKLKQSFPDVTCVIGDVRDYQSLVAAMSGHDMVVHMAALKRIPECEKQPRECIETNVLGTDNVLRASAVVGVSESIVISTDKACSAVTVYGASKLLTEGLMAHYSRQSQHTRFHGVRYGNVIASTGSVIELWKRQHSREEPLSVTDAEMSRFWMSPFDAVDLIHNSVDTGSSVISIPKASALSIIEMAELLYPDYPRTILGLRSNEKTHEDLLNIYEPAVEEPSRFLVSTESEPRWEAGKSYTSKDAPRLKVQDLQRMIADAEEIEKW